MKLRYLSVVFLLFLVTGCGCSKVNNNSSQGYLYYLRYDFNSGKSIVSKTNLDNLENETLLETDMTVAKISVNDRVYGLFYNKIGYINGNGVKYIDDSSDLYVGRMVISNGKIYYGLDNSNASDNIFEKFAMMDTSGQGKVVHEMGIGQLAVDNNNVYFKPNSGSEVHKLLKYYLDGNNKKVIYEANLAYLTVSEDYLYFLNYSDGSSIYRINKDGSGAVKVVNGPISLPYAIYNQSNGDYSMATIGNVLYFINGADGNRLYKVDGLTVTKVSDANISQIKAYNNELYITYTTKSGIYLWDKEGNEIKQLVNVLISEYVIK